MPSTREGNTRRADIVLIMFSQRDGMEIKSFKKIYAGGFPGGAVVENLPANAGDTGSSPGLGRPHMPRSN